MKGMKLHPGHDPLDSRIARFELRSDDGRLVAVLHATDRGLKIESDCIVNHELLVSLDASAPPAIVIDLATGMEHG